MNRMSAVTRLTGLEVNRYEGNTDVEFFAGVYGALGGSGISLWYHKPAGKFVFYALNGGATGVFGLNLLAGQFATRSFLILTASSLYTVFKRVHKDV